MKFCLIHHNTPGDTLEAFLDYAAETGFDSVELTISDVWSDETDPTEREAERVRKMLEARGLEVAAVSSENDFIVIEEDQIRAQVERMARICKFAQLVGTHIIRTEGGSRKKEIPVENECAAMAECLKRCLGFVEKDGIYLGVDNHGVVTNDAELQLKLFSMVDSPNVGATLDTMNYRWMGHPVETCNRFYDLIAPRVFHTHVKDGTGSQKDYVGRVLGDGEIDLNHALAALKRVGYQGVYCAEWEGRGDKAQGYAKCLEWMKQHITI